jgi:hypothetical protein
MVLAMRSTRLLAASAFCVAILPGQPSSEPSIETNYPGMNANRFVNLTLSGFPQHPFAMHSHGTRCEMSGVLFARFLEAAGWRSIPEDKRDQFLVRIEGESGEVATLGLAEALRRSLEDRSWLTREQCGTHLSRAAAPWLVVVDVNDAATLAIKRVRSIRVTNVAEQQLVKDVEFGRLSAYENGQGTRMLWKEYVRVEGISVMIATWSGEGRHGKSAVLLSEQVSKWDERRLLDFLAGKVALRIDSKAKIKRGDGFTIVGLRAWV